MMPFHLRRSPSISHLSTWKWILLFIAALLVIILIRTNTHHSSSAPVPIPVTAELARSGLKSLGSKKSSSTSNMYTTDSPLPQSDESYSSFIPSQPNSPPNVIESSIPTSPSPSPSPVPSRSFRFPLFPSMSKLRDSARNIVDVVSRTVRRIPARKELYADKGEKGNTIESDNYVGIPLTKKSAAPVHLHAPTNWDYLPQLVHANQPVLSNPLSIVTATRFWSSTPHDHQRLHSFIQRALTYSDLILIALNMEKDQGTIEYVERMGWRHEKVQLLPILPWSGISTVLNSLLLHAASYNVTRLLYQSIEIEATAEQIHTLVDEVDENTLVAGAVLDGHVFTPGVQELNGVNGPWNTLAVWHVPSLLKTGFSTVADGYFDTAYGQEEVPTISLLQLIASSQSPHHDPVATIRSTVKLIQLREEVIWAHSFRDSTQRKQWHQTKMSSKRSRAIEHLKQLGIKAGTVVHVIPKSYLSHGQKVKSKKYIPIGR